MISSNPIDEYIEKQDPIHKANLCTVRDTDPKEASRSGREDFVVNAYMVEGSTSSTSRQLRIISASIRELRQWNISRMNSRNVA